MDSFDRNPIYIWDEGEYSYPAAYGFRPNLRAFIHEDDERRSCMLVVPGGGYCMCTPHEGELVALEFYRQGMNAFVLTYTTDITMSVPLKKQPMSDLSRAIKYIRSNAAEYKIDADRLAICGFSAGGHLCSCLATHFDELKDGKYQDISDRPDAVILGYPVITSGEYTHIYSIQALIGYEPDEEEKRYFSSELNVKENTPLCFIWQTLKDSLVPVENSYLFAEALKKKGVPYAQYVFPNGDHGLSLADFEAFARGAGGDYVMEQLGKALEHVKAGTAVNVSDRRREELMQQFFSDKSKKNDAEDGNTDVKNSDMPSLADVAMWPKLAEIWLNGVLGK